MSVQREGGCACGAVRYRLTSEPLFIHCCHCLNCQRQTGSAFVINLLIETDRVELLAGDPEPVSVPRGAGKKQKIWRCPTCQVAVYSQYTTPKIRFVRGGTLDDPASVEPDVHIYIRSKLPWVTLPGIGAGIQHVLRHEEAVAGRQSRASRSAQAMSHHDYRRTSYETWEAMAPGWERWRAQLEDALTPVRTWLISRLAPQPGDTVLELGPGRATRASQQPRSSARTAASSRATSRRRWWKSPAVEAPNWGSRTSTTA